MTKARSPVMGTIMIVIVIAASVALRKSVPDPNTRIAIGAVEIALIAIIAFGFLRPR